MDFKSTRSFKFEKWPEFFNEVKSFEFEFKVKSLNIKAILKKLLEKQVQTAKTNSRHVRDRERPQSL